jgi:hypothetical protein
MTSPENNIGKQFEEYARIFKRPRPLYHGSSVRINPGDIVQPNRHPLQDEDEPIYAHASLNRDEAKEYAYGDGQRGYIHVVTPLEGDETLEQGDPYGSDRHHIASQKGFRVLSVRKLHGIG